ncbi:Asp23/Gls24 family envelope stress response protein [Modestobacter sp. I12A-02628]|uniref:Asp23/Gls24 family envelope stress response protein n=1 Tax=Goekera deserti TaxID=2497753 RepID=A0A7K3WIL8_9ACTN|nr:Asp23/Gls24 family envelope stress response protein [Goekera deserti]MPQ96640.1 Asp23/Gls24 family envelope stress response protein [Goekera deserti]NDI47048.1 Asp23/Gls24 family envelope stress response protein [Goekera deserti]NEL56284.1 Asp23/Gls24 family envelope stress response protein [Goekera deserti]
MTTSDSAEGTQLPCGRSLDALWAGLASGTAAEPDEHERTCPHCRTARDGLGALLGAVHGARAERDEPPPSSLRERIMGAVRAEVRRGELLPLASTPHGVVTISAQAVAVVVRFAADTVPGVRARRCAVQLAGEPGTSADGVLQVELSLVVPAGPRPIPDVVDDVRSRVAGAVDRSVGARLGRLDVVVEDVLDAGGPDSTGGAR